MFNLNLTEQTNNILNVFTKTVKKLQEINKKADNAITDNNVIIEELSQRIIDKNTDTAQLNVLKNKNLKVIENINKMFE